MPTKRALQPEDIASILEWAEQWQSIPTREEIARKFNVSEATVTRIVKSRGYQPLRKRKADIESLAAMCSESFASVPRESMEATHEA